MTPNIIIPLFSPVIILCIGIALYFKISREKAEKNKSTEVSELVFDGLLSFCRRAVSSIIQILLYLTIVLLLFSILFNKPFSWIQITAFFIGGILMSVSSYVSLILAPRLVPIIIQNSNRFLSKSLHVLFDASCAIGFIIMGLIISGLSFCFYFLGTETVIGYGLGITLAAFFLRIGGGLYKAANNISSDIVLEIEKNLPEKDTRNPAIILDMVGEYVGEIIGYSSDILGSFAFTVISCILFALSLFYSGFINEAAFQKMLALPLLLFSASFLVAIIAYIYGKIRIGTRNVDNFLLESLYVAILLCGIATYFIIQHLNLHIDISMFWGGKKEFSPFIPYLIGLLGAVLITFTSDYLTSYHYKPAKKIAKQAEFGSVISLFNGFSAGLKSSGLYLFYIILMTVPSFYFAGFYGLAMAAMGMLSMTCTILSINTFTPLATTTNKIVQLSMSHETVSRNTSTMNTIGRTTKALGNGYASGAAIMSTFSLFFSLVILSQIDLQVLFLVDLKLLSGLIIGIILPSIFSGFLLQGLTKTILATLTEVSRQFREIPYLYENKAKPDIIKASDDNARSAMDSLIIPGIIMALAPIIVGYVFGTKMLLGLALGIFLTSINQGFTWANMGDVLSNARYYIEAGNFGGPESRTFQHILTADNVGNAYKDLLSPSTTTMIKSVTIIATLIILLLTL